MPKVALIVGPAGSMTDAYRALADEAAAAARGTGAEVVKVYSPNATWPAVKQAVTGASIVVYLGHGNGWPSRYRDALYPPTQNGFGLNPAPGGDDSTHQYFGEASVGKLHLAPNAIVVLSHLCYASGNTEPGLPEGTSEQAIQRVDNFAAGFLRAGARAVVAEAYLGPAYYVRSLLRGRGSIEAIWSGAPTVNNRHPITAPSTRTPGYNLHLDPDHAASGFVRSLVSRGVTAAEVRAGASGVAGRTGTSGSVTPALEPTLASAGIRFGEPAFRSLPIAGARTSLTLPLTAGRSTRIPAGAQVSIRWDPILLDSPASPSPEPSAAPAATPAPTTTPAPSPSPLPVAPTASPVAAGVPAWEVSPPKPAPPTAAATPSPTPTPEPTPVLVAPSVDLVVPEAVGSVVEPVRATRGARGLSLKVRYPTEPGLYRIVATLHTPAGVAYDAATQALLTPMLVRVGGSMAVAYGTPPALDLAGGESRDIAVRVLNAGAVRWDQVVTLPPSRVAAEPVAANRTATLAPELIATWLSVDGQAVPDPVRVRLDPVVAAPGGTVDAVLALAAPADEGSYLLLVDVVVPGSGPLSSFGSSPALIRVTVGVAPSPSPLVIPSLPAAGG